MTNGSYNLDDLNKELENDLEGNEIEQEEIEEIKSDAFRKPHFPLMIFILALFKDLIDIVSLGIIGAIINIVVSIIIRIYLFGKVSFVKRMIYKKFLTSQIVEYIPIVNMIPLWTIFVIRAYLTEKKAINRVLTALEKALAKII